MDEVAVDYLKKVGVKSDGSVSSSNYRFPTISCKLRDEDDGGKNEIASNLVFTLSYFISDDFSKQSLEFTFQDWYNWKRGEEIENEVSVSSFDTIKRNLGFDFFQYFSITETLLTRIYQSRLKGRKAWKKRNFRLPLKKSAALKAFGVEKVNEKTSGTCSFTRSPDLVMVVENIVELDEVMNLCVHKAAQDFSYAPFDVYFDCYKKKLKLEKMMSEKGTNERNDISLVRHRINRDKVFKEFAKQVVLLQKNG